MSDTVQIKAKAPVVEKKVEEKGLSNDVVTKYQTASTILASVIAKLIPQIEEGKAIIDLCNEGDRLIEEGVAAVYNKKGVKISKGIAFPTSLSVNNVVSHFSPLVSDTGVPVLAKGDVVKVQLGAQIDGYASIHAETLVVGATDASPVEDRKADAIEAAYQAAQAAMRLIKVGGKGYDVTEGVQKVAKEFKVLPVEGQLSCQHLQNTPDGPKRIIINPPVDQKREEYNKVFEEGEVYGIDVLITTSADGKARTEEAKTTIYKKSDITYQLKMKTSRTTFAEIQKKAGAFPFTLRCLEEEKRARMGVQEAVQHGLLRPYEVVHTEKSSVVAQFFFTLALLPAGPLLLSPSPVWYGSSKVKSAESIKDEELKTLIASKLRVDKKKAKKAAKAAGEGEEKKE
ncbi:Metallopeptidase [Phaffia rhodozyma]|uniref:Metallopeptidase n=1 Tax=Phaffia rhodozyma TaxID=264483 RepID=A0A0F7SSB4_PHARH|nr:Metallopeptidase [Phaffia rhodozyma]